MDDISTADIYAHMAAILEAERAGISRVELEHAPPRVRDQQAIARLTAQLDAVTAERDNLHLQVEALLATLTTGGADTAHRGRRMWLVGTEGA